MVGGKGRWVERMKGGGMNAGGVKYRCVVVNKQPEALIEEGLIDVKWSDRGRKGTLWGLSW